MRASHRFLLHQGVSEGVGVFRGLLHTLKSQKRAEPIRVLQSFPQEVLGRVLSPPVVLEVGGLLLVEVVLVHRRQLAFLLLNLGQEAAGGTGK